LFGQVTGGCGNLKWVGVFCLTLAVVTCGKKGRRTARFEWTTQCMNE
jgi:hypothetical protein